MVMEEEEKDIRSDLSSVLYKAKNTFELITRILKNNKMVEELKAVLNKKNWCKPATDANVVKKLMAIAANVIKERYSKARNMEEMHS